VWKLRAHQDHTVENSEQAIILAGLWAQGEPFVLHSIENQKILITQMRKKFPRAETDANGRRRIFFENVAGSLVLGNGISIVR
jgi:hypothetical protein